MAKFTASEKVVIARAKERLSKRGAWCQGCSARNKDKQSVGAFNEGAVSWCAYGALGREAGYAMPDRLAAKLMEHNRLYTTIDEWNDDPKRTKKEVLKLFTL